MTLPALVPKWFTCTSCGFSFPGSQKHVTAIGDLCSECTRRLDKGWDTRRTIWPVGPIVLVEPEEEVELKIETQEAR